MPAGGLVTFLLNQRQDKGAQHILRNLLGTSTSPLTLSQGGGLKREMGGPKLLQTTHRHAFQ